MRIIIDIPSHADEDFKGVTERELEFLLGDALHEFNANRGPSAEEYVEKRYATQSDAFKARKVAEVRRRRAIAETLHNAALLNLTLEK